MFLRNSTGNKFIYTKAIKTKNDSLFKSVTIQDNSSINNNSESYPIKPSQNIIPQDINLQKIFFLMKKTSRSLTNKYSNILYKNTQTKFERKSMINKIKEYFMLNRIEPKIFFKTILLYDILIIENAKIKLLTSFEEIVLGALILSIKFNYVENKMFSMKNFLTFYKNKSFTLQQLFDIERKCLKIINYYLNYNTPMCFLEFFLMNGIIFDTDSIKSHNYYKIYLEVETALEKIMKESNNYLKYNFFFLVCSIVYYCRSLFNLVGWPTPLKKIFGVDINDFKVEYKAILSNEDIILNYDNINNNKDKAIKEISNIILLDIKKQEIEDKKKYEKSNYSIYSRNANNNLRHYKSNIINININNFAVNSIYNTIYNNSNSKNTKKAETTKKILNINNSYNSHKRKIINNVISNKEMNNNNFYFKYNNTLNINNSIINNKSEINLSNNYSGVCNKKKLIYISPIKANNCKNEFSNKNYIILNNNKENKKENNKENNKVNNNKVNNYKVNNIKEKIKCINKDKSLRKIEIDKTKKIRNYNFTSRFKTENNYKAQNNDFNTSYKKKDKTRKFLNVINADIKKEKADIVKITSLNKKIDNTENIKSDKNYANVENKKDINTLKNNRPLNNKNLFSIYKKYIVNEEKNKKSNDSLIKGKRSYDKYEKDEVFYNAKNKKNNNNNNITSVKNGYNYIINKYGNTKVQKLHKLNYLSNYSSNKESINYLHSNDYITPKKVLQKDIVFKTKSKEDSKNNKPQTTANKIKYNNLIKYKLSISSSLSKKKEDKDKKD